MKGVVMRGFRKRFKLAVFLLFFINTSVFCDSENDRDMLKAIEEENLIQISKLISENPDIIKDSYEKISRNQFVIKSVLGKKYKSMTELLRCGLNPNEKDDSCATPLFFLATNCCYPENNANKIKFLEYLLSNGANPNIEVIRKNKLPKTTPLMNVCGYLVYDFSENALTVAELLIKYGADINYKNELGQTPLSTALENANIDIAYFLIISCKCEIEGFHYDSFEDYNNDCNKVSNLQLLRRIVIDLRSPKYKKKKQIIKEFKKKGLDYKKEPIPKEALDLIKQFYPEKEELYLKKY